MKEILVSFITNELKDSYESLKDGRFEEKELYELIGKIIDNLKNNPSCGIKIPKKFWPKEYITKYEITNLWKCNLPKGWRLVYTIDMTELRVMNIILEWFKHKNYERRFNY